MGFLTCTPLCHLNYVPWSEADRSAKVSLKTWSPSGLTYMYRSHCFYPYDPPVPRSAPQCLICKKCIWGADWHVAFPVISWFTNNKETNLLYRKIQNLIHLDHFLFSGGNFSFIFLKMKLKRSV